MAKEKFLIVATKMPDDCFGRFNETANRAAISAGTADESDPYAWIEGSFEIQLIRDKEATYICSLSPSAHYIWLANAFAGEPNAAWQYDGDPEGLENESGGESHGYETYRDNYDSRFVCDTFTIDTMRDLDEPMRAPNRNRMQNGDKAERYHDAIWEAAEEIAREIGRNGGFYASILDVYTYRQWEAETAARSRRYHAPQGTLDEPRLL